MNVRILGCSGGIGAGVRTTSILIDDDILIDAGTGLADLTLDEMAAIRHIFVTHSHLDHVACIPLLIDTIFERVSTPVVIHGQESTLRALQSHIFNWVVWPDFAELPRAEAPVLSYQVLSPGEIIEVDGRWLEMIPVNHIVPAVGYRVSREGGAFAFSGDTTSNDTLWAALNAHEKLDFLLVESAFANKDMQLSQLARHYCPQLLAEDMVKLKHDCDIYISHRQPGQEDDILRECRELMPERRIHGLEGGKVFTL